MKDFLEQGYEFFNAHGYVLELLVSTAIFTWRLERRPRFPLRVLAGAAVLLTVSLLWKALPVGNAWSDSLFTVILYGLCISGIYFSFRVSRWQAVFFLTAAGAVQHLVFKLSRTLEYLSYAAFGPNPWSAFVVYPVMELLLFFLCFLLFDRRLRGLTAKGTHSGSVTGLLVGLLICTDLFQNLYIAYDAGVGPEVTTLFNLFGIMTCLFILTLQIAIVNWEKEQQDSAILKHMLHQQKEQLAVSKETIDLINVKCHDIKNQLASLDGRVLPDMMADWNRTLSIYDSAAHTGNEALDVLLAEKSLLCEQRHIRFECIADGASLSFLTPSDIYSLLGNALENAMEAVAKLPDGEERYIRLRISMEKGMVMLHMENPYAGELAFRDGLPDTTKQDKRYHGFGMKSIRLITQRYHGFLSVKAEGGVFALNILLPVS